MWGGASRVLGAGIVEDVQVGELTFEHGLGSRPRSASGQLIVRASVMRPGRHGQRGGAISRRGGPPSPVPRPLAAVGGAIFSEMIRSVSN